MKACKEKSNFFEERGITLIAMVITIIVLLILAVVSIATLTGENGLLAKAIKAKNETDKSEAEEQVKIAVMASYNQEGKLDIDTVKKELEKIEGEVSITDTNGDFPINVTMDNYLFGIDRNGNITEGTGEEGDNNTGDGELPPTTEDNAMNNRVEELEKTVALLQEELQIIKEKSGKYYAKSYNSFTIPKATNGNYAEVWIDTISIEKDCKLLVSSWMAINTHSTRQVGNQIAIYRNNNMTMQAWTGNTYPYSGASSITRAFDCKAGDELKFRAWNWDTTQEININSANLVIQEI